MVDILNQYQFISAQKLSKGCTKWVCQEKDYKPRSQGGMGMFLIYSWVVCGEGHSLGGCLTDMHGVEGQLPVSEESGLSRPGGG